MRRLALAPGIAPIACILALLAGCGASLDAPRGNANPVVTQPGHIRHVVVLMMENRSFDHFLGWLPGADGKQAGLAYLDGAGASHPTYALAPDFQGCGHSDPDHSYQGGRQEVNGGRMDGWLRAGQNDLFAIGYYGAQDLAFWGQAAGGLLWTNHKYPAFGGPPYNSQNDGPNADASVFNFTPQGGVGIHYFIRPRRSIDFSANGIHISSASLGDRNPGVNASVQFSLGYTWWK